MTNEHDNEMLSDLLASVRGRKDAFQANKERIDTRHAEATARAQDEAREHEAQMRREQFTVYSGDSR